MSPELALSDTGQKLGWMSGTERSNPIKRIAVCKLRQKFVGLYLEFCSANRNLSFVYSSLLSMMCYKLRRDCFSQVVSLLRVMFGDTESNGPNRGPAGRCECCIPAARLHYRACGRAGHRDGPFMAAGRLLDLRWRPPLLSSRHTL